MRWWLKAALQKGLSWMPGGRGLHHFLQQNVWRSLKINDDFLIDRLSHVNKHLAAWHHYHPDRLPPNTLELGAGWYPIVPLGLYLSGVEQSYTLDQNRYLNGPRFAELMNYLQDWQQKGLLRQYLPTFRPARWEQLQRNYQLHQNDFPALLQSLNLQYWVGDGRALPYSADHFALIHSNNTFEHISPLVLQDLLTEMKRVLKPSGVMSHYIDMADHYSYTDSKISPLHYLRFTERQWSWIENRFQSQNRLRINQYLGIYSRLFMQTQILAVEKANIEQFNALSLAAPFCDFSAEDVRVLYAQLVSIK